MQHNHRTRLAALEQAANASHDTIRQVQVVIYNPANGAPLNPPDANAIKQIWMADDGRGLQRPAR